MVSWTDNIPDAGHTLANDQPLMENNFTYLATDLAVDHNFTKNSATSQDGYHKVIHFVNQAGNPDPVTNTGQLFTVNSTLGGFSDQGLAYLSGGNKFTQLTSAANPQATASGSITYLPGGLILICGTFTQNVDPFNFTFPNINAQVWGAGFPTNCFGVNVTPCQSAGFTVSSNFRITAFSKTGLTLITTSITTPYVWSYMAFGN